MGFVEAVRSCLSNYVTFSGRARRPEYWWFWLACILAGLVASALDAALFGSVETSVTESVTRSPGGDVTRRVTAASEVNGPISGLVGLATLLPLLAAGWRRMHDVGRSGWWSLLAAGTTLVSVPLGMAIGGTAGAVLAVVPPLVATIVVFVWLLSPSEAGENRFGPEPPAAGTGGRAA